MPSAGDPAKAVEESEAEGFRSTLVAWFASSLAGLEVVALSCPFAESALTTS